MSAPRAGPLRIGVFGGAFDPPHLAHRALVQAALGQLGLDRLSVVPTGQAWHKPRELSAAKDRVAMARLAFEDLPGVQVDDRETRRAGPSYTIDTLRALQAEQPLAQFFLLIGQDQARVLHTWRAWEEVLRLATVVVAARDDHAGDAAPFVPPPRWAARYLPLRLARIDLSASEIRQRARAGENLVPLVGEAVARYIAHHHLYRST